MKNRTHLKNLHAFKESLRSMTLVPYLTIRVFRKCYHTWSPQLWSVQSNIAMEADCRLAKQWEVLNQNTGTLQNSREYLLRTPLACRYRIYSIWPDVLWGLLLSNKRGVKVFMISQKPHVSGYYACCIRIMCHYSNKLPKWKLFD